MEKSQIKKMVLLASVSPVALFFGGGANAADLALKAPAAAAAPPPVYSWTGCYVGAHVGWGWGHQDPKQVGSGSSGGGGFSASHSLDSSGGLFGGQVGCNYQFASTWVAGIQGDIAGTDINGRGNDPAGFLFNDDDAIGVQTTWLASVTARLGMTAWNNRALFYGKGGVAWDQNKWDLSDTFDTSHPNFITESRTGWTVGGGVEWIISPSWPNWTGFAEFNYYDFGGNGTTVPESGAITLSTGKQTIETVKVGLNYKFTGN